MTALLAIILGLPAVHLLFSVCRGYIRNLEAARRSGLPFISVPVFAMANWWFTVQVLVLPLLRRTSGNKDWIPLCGFFDLWHYGRAPFDRAKSDTFITVSPQGNILWTCDAEVIMQLGSSCPSARLMCSPLNLYGPCIAGVRGEETRRYRKAMAPFFNETTHQRIWRIALEETQGLLLHWRQPFTESRQSFKMQKDALRLMLHIASATFFSQPCSWSTQIKPRTIPLVNGHVMEYDTALLSMVQLIWVIALMPSFLLAIPALIFKRASIAYREWGQYMREMRDSHIVEHQKDNSSRDLLDTLLEACPELSKIAEEKCFDLNGTENAVQSTSPQISPEAVLGNMFLAILAGHETSAHTLVLILTVLACRPEIQEELHSELDKVLGLLKPEEWTYRRDCSRLLQGYTGALVYESLRVWPMAPAILKTTENIDRTISIGGHAHVISNNTLVLMHTAAAQTNQKYWHGRKPGLCFPGEAYPYPLSSFDPMRWLSVPEPSRAKKSVDETWMDSMRPESEKKQRLRLAEPGTFLPFSEGASACIGSRMAVVEVVAALAVICTQFQVCLAVEPGETWNDRRRKTAEQVTSGMRFRVALHIGDPIALKFIPRTKD